jgi:hypothetical protein
MTALTTPEQIALYRIAALKAAVKLEMMGLRRSSKGRSATAIAREEMGLGKSTPRAEVLRALEMALS